MKPVSENMASPVASHTCTLVQYAANKIFSDDDKKISLAVNIESAEFQKIIFIFTTIINFLCQLHQES